MRIIVLTVLLLLLLFSGFTSMAQDSQSSRSEDPQYKLYSFVSTQESLNRMYPQERVYLHLDNTSYFLGDTLWFMSYLQQYFPKRDQGITVPSRFWTCLKKKGLPAEQVSSSDTKFYVDIDPSARFHARLWLRRHDTEDDAKWVRGTMYQGRVNGYFLQDSYLSLGFLEASEYQKIVSNRMFLRYPNTELWEMIIHFYIRSYFLDMDNGEKLNMDIRGYEGFRKDEYENDQIPMDRVNKINLYDNKVRFSYRKEQNHRTYVNYLADMFFVKYPKSAFVDDMPKPNIRLTQMEGYSMPKAFSSGKAKPMPGDVDYRRTLYWNSDVRADFSGQASVSFYNNGRCRDIVISAEGLSPEGSLLVLK